MKCFDDLGILVLAACALGAVACAGQKELVTPQYMLTMPGFWETKATSKAAGEPSEVVIGQYGDAVIDTGAGSGGSQYDAVTADVHVWIYAWPATPSGASALEQSRVHLRDNPVLALPSHAMIPEQPMECGQFPRSFQLGGQTLPAVDLVRRPGWRTTLLAGVFDAWLVAVVARVDFEQDVNRYCHNLRNMRTQLQNLLDGLRVGVTTAAKSPAPVP
jgi:hypothetical protein